LCLEIIFPDGADGSQGPIGSLAFVQSKAPSFFLTIEIPIYTKYSVLYFMLTCKVKITISSINMA